MTCASCVRRVRHTLVEEPGVSGAEVILGTREAVVTFDPDVANEKRSWCDSRLRLRG